MMTRGVTMTQTRVCENGLGVIFPGGGRVVFRLGYSVLYFVP